jgi:hypothetical protein
MFHETLRGLIKGKGELHIVTCEYGHDVRRGNVCNRKIIDYVPDSYNYPDIKVVTFPPVLSTIFASLLRLRGVKKLQYSTDMCSRHISQNR